MFSFLISFASDASAASSFTQSLDKVTTSGTSALAEALGSPFLAAMNALLYAVFAFFGLLLIIAGVLLDWAINPNNFELVMNMDAIKTTWITVRDFLNLFFIMVLLFSAFCTIFQVSKYSIKKILLTLVIMALLVNFSYPISRFIIDAANIPMYFIINNTFPGLSNESGISTLLVSFSNILVSIIPEPKWFSWGQGPMGSQLTIKLIAANIFVFILTISLLIMAILFVIRMIVLAILIMFSPIGFVASIFPGLNSFSSKWWDALLKQAFWGPIMAFMLYISLKVMGEMQSGKVGEEMNKFANANGGNFSEIIVGGVTMAIPVVLIWIGMISAKQMGAIGADKAQKWGTKAVKWAARAPLKYSGIEGGAKKGWDNFKKTGKVFGKKVPMYGGTDATEAREAKWAGLIKDGKGGWDKARISQEREKANEQRKKWKDQGGASDDELNKTLNEKDASKKKAAALELAEKNGFKNLKQYQDAMDAVKDDPVYKNMFEDKAKEKHIRYVIEDKAQKGIDRVNKNRADKGLLPLDSVKESEVRKSFYKTELGKMSADKIAKQKNLLGNGDFRKYYLDDLNRNDHGFLVKIASKADQRYRKLWKDKYGYKI